MSKTILQRSRGAIVGIAAMMALSSLAGAQIRRDTIPAGTVVPVQLDQPLSSRSSNSGERFMATVKSGSDDAGLPAGTRIEGVVRNAVSSGEGKPGVLDVAFRRIIFPNGTSQNITASVYSLNGKDVTRRDGRLVASGNKSQDQLKWVGIGAGAGLLLSQVVKGNTLLDILLGAGGGYLYSQTQNKRAGDVSLNSGTEFGVRFDRDVSIPADTIRYYRRNPNNDDTYLNRDYDRPNDRYYNDQSTNRYYRRDQYLESGNGSSSVTVILDDQTATFGRMNRPYTRNGVVYLPLAAMGRLGHFDYRYDSANRMIYANNDDMRLSLDSRWATINGERRRLPAMAEMHNGVLFVPMQFIGWAMGASVDWNADTRTVRIST